MVQGVLIMATNEVPFNRVVIPSEGGNPGIKFAEFLNIDEDSEITLAEMQSYLYDRLFRLGMVRHVDGTRARRPRAREREAAKRRRGTSSRTRSTKAKAKPKAKPKAKAKAKSRKTGSKKRRSAKAKARRR